MTPRPTHILRHEHRVIEQVLRALDGMCLRLKAGDEVPAKALSQALEFIQTYADGHHHRREEEYFFPALKECGFEEGGALRFLQEEHTLERKLLADLEFAVEQYRRGDADAVLRFVGISDRFCQHLIGHMQKEDSLLFRMAEDLLDDDAKNELMQKLARSVADSREAWNHRYEQIAAELENVWTI